MPDIEKISFKDLLFILKNKKYPRAKHIKLDKTFINSCEDEITRRMKILNSRI